MEKFFWGFKVEKFLWGFWSGFGGMEFFKELKVGFDFMEECYWIFIVFKMLLFVNFGVFLDVRRGWISFNNLMSVLVMVLYLYFWKWVRIKGVIVIFGVVILVEF